MIEPVVTAIHYGLASAVAVLLRGVAGRRGSVVVVVGAAFDHYRPAASALDEGAPASRHRVWHSRRRAGREDAGSQQSSRHGHSASAGAHLGAAGDEDHAHESSG
jgi:hypothetical protein